MTYTSLQNYTNLVVGEHGIQTFEVEVVVLLSIDVFVAYIIILVIDTPNLIEK